MKTSTRPDSSSRSRVAGAFTLTRRACFNAAAITGSMKVPACTATCTPGRSMSSHCRTARLLRVVTA